MIAKRIATYILCLGIIGATYDLMGQSLDSLDFSVSPAPEWTDLFHRDSGWFGADGIFSIPLSGMEIKGHSGNEETLLFFSDTYVGKVKDGKPVPGEHKMVNNTMAIVEGMGASPEKITFKVQEGESGESTSFFIPRNSIAGEGEYFWLGDGFIHPKSADGDTNLYLLAYHIEMTGPNVFDFRQNNVSMIRVPVRGGRPVFEEQDQIPTHFQVQSPVLGEGSLGSGVFVNTSWAGAPNPDGYIYTYGVVGQDKHLIVARVEDRRYEELNAWEFWAGGRWSENIEDLASLAAGVSNELSFTPMEDGRYILVFQVFGISDKVGAMLAASPTGPFGKIIELYRTPEYDEGLLPYNAKAHYNLSEPGELLISYNTISFDFWNDIQKDAHIYRPRFIRVKFGK